MRTTHAFAVNANVPAFECGAQAARPTHKTGFKLFYAQRSRVNAFFHQFTSFIFKFLSVAPSKHPFGDGGLHAIALQVRRSYLNPACAWVTIGALREKNRGRA